MGVRLELVWDNTQVSGLGDWLAGDDQAQAQELGWKGEEPQDGLSVRCVSSKWRLTRENGHRTSETMLYPSLNLI